MRERLACLLIVLFVGVGTSTGAATAAEEVTASELRTLAARAEHDPEARRELTEVRRVDGRPVDVAAALEGADETERRSRLRTLAEGAEGAPVVGARDDAKRILDGRRYNPAEPPRPLRGVLRRIGGWLRPIGDLLAKLSIPDWAKGVLGLAVVAVAVAVAARLVSRRKAAAVASDEGREFRRRRHDDPAALEHQADDAERSGDYDLAVRLRFRAGLLRLDAAGVVELRPSLTTGELRRRLRSDTMRDLTTTFEAVAYAGEPADADDVAAARRDWPRVLQEARR
ncbi:MAG TPA: DUF4129 domain-containing protein [Acidimicrobiales bacterium]|nr:DUF4129 domain-containing protein [Acidimicrobiales bacterium]